MYIKIRVQWTYNYIHNNHSRYKVLQIKMCLDTFLKVSKGNNLISKSRAFHNVGAAYTKDLSKNELAHILLIGGIHNKQGSQDARVRIVVLLIIIKPN